jgi:hypothetical protein
MRMPVRRSFATGGKRHGVLRTIAVSTVLLGPKARENCHRHADKKFKATGKTGNPPTFQISAASLYVDEPGTTG